MMISQIFEIIDTKFQIKPISKHKTCYFVDPAFWAGKEKLTSASRDDQQKQIMCNVCAEPPVGVVGSFSWEFKGRPLRETVSQIMITDWGQK